MKHCTSFITLLVFAGHLWADPPGPETSFHELESRAYNEIEMRIEDTFYRTDRVLYNDMRETLIKNGVRLYQDELRHLRSSLERIAREKPNTAREAINVNFSFLENKALTLKNIDFEIERFKNYVDFKQEAFSAVKDSYGKDIWNWAHSELQWASRVHFELRQVKNLLLSFADKIDQSREFISEIAAARQSPDWSGSLKSSCAKLGFNLPL